MIATGIFCGLCAVIALLAAIVVLSRIVYADNISAVTGLTEAGISLLVLAFSLAVAAYWIIGGFAV